MVSERIIISKKVCVIGAGPSGLVAAREMRKEGHNVVVLEQNHDVGGQWLYDPNVEEDEIENPMGRSGGGNSNNFLKVHSSIYSSLRLTSPREIMGFTDFPFVTKKDRDTRRFPGHRELLLYLQDFCEHFKLRDLIRFNTRVTRVEMVECPILGNDELKWAVGSTPEEDEAAVEDVYDAVVVATGHYSQPRLPKIKGMDEWRRRQIHSHIYRIPQPFRNQVVVVVGNSLSGQDISMELKDVATSVHLSAKSLHISQGLSDVIHKYDRMHLHPQIESLHEDGRVLFVDGSWIVADAIIYCTGYSYSFPFLHTKDNVTVDDDRVGPLFEHTFPPSLAPSLSFVGIPRKLIGFPFFEAQAKWISQVLSGKIRLPSCDDMIKSVHQFYHSKDMAGIPNHNTHDLASFEYCDKYGDYIGFPHLEEWRKQLCLSALRNSETNLETYRDIYDDDEEMLQEAYQSSHFTQIIEHDP